MYLSNGQRPYLSNKRSRPSPWTFKIVWSSSLLVKLAACGMSCCLHTWISSFFISCSQHIAINIVPHLDKQPHSWFGKPSRFFFFNHIMLYSTHPIIKQVFSCHSADLEFIRCWSNNWNLSFCRRKPSSLRRSDRIVQLTHLSYFHGHPLEEVQHQFLSLTVSHGLSWTDSVSKLSSVICKLGIL